MPCEDFFTIITQFIESLEKVARENQQIKFDKERAAMKKSTRAPAATATPADSDKAVIDDTLRALKGGQFFKQRREGSRIAAAPVPVPK
jgi:hypothetical protein